MAARAHPPAETIADREIVIAHVLNAPRELAWKAWAERHTFDTNHDSMRMGWAGTFDQLAEYLANA